MLAPPPGSAILVTGTGMPTLDVIRRVVDNFDVPVHSSNLCGVWWLSRTLGMKGGSSLFETAAVRRWVSSAPSCGRILTLNRLWRPIA